ncbi:NAD-P-binding protein [Epithele typhae]|uniref:NAD-P-binding protein n=1 Tax=Epithele typhae TaxID=378194 RepID=UPI002007F3A9|nr:NAD-P-binding protein [Epithele typhae]KAH9932721.1 NAD-P-binding protein [Epithele typhae]
MLPSAASSRRPSPLRPGGSHYDPVTPMDDEVHPVIHEGRVAVITGAANGIGRAAAVELAKIGLKIAIADIDEVKLEETAKLVREIVGDANLITLPTDVTKIDQVQRLRDRVIEAWGEVGLLLNNAAIGLKGTSWDGLDKWHTLFEINLFGVLNVQHTFVPNMLHQENPAVIINTGSKQGITNPPGNASYNAAKAAVKSLTESLAHELRETPSSNLSAHLFIPGWTWTGMTGSDSGNESRWGVDCAGDGTLDKVRQGKFYIVCPDNETRREVDQLRIMWGAGDVAEGRPALSRWHQDYKALFQEYIRDGLEALD